jgi:hypothetical protein
MTFLETCVLWLGNCYWQNSYQTMLGSLVKSCPAALAKMLRIELIGQGVALARLLSHFLPVARGGSAKEEREHSNRHKTYCSLQAFGPGLIAT